jgi:D-lyxose ketol-isomerase
MKRSEINKVIQQATTFFERNAWSLPPKAKWDVTDFGLGDFDKCGLVLVNLAEEAEYCEKLMYARRDQLTPVHKHQKKKEDIICRVGMLAVRLWNKAPIESATGDSVSLQVNGELKEIPPGDKLVLKSGERVTILPGIWHEFYPDSEECIIGEVSTANDDLNDNFFADSRIGRFSQIEEDEPAMIKLLSDA